MIYAVSDIHGHYEKYLELIGKIDLKPDDTLYVLGDILDRGKQGFKTLLDISSRPNVVGMWGNHESAALLCLPLMLKLADSQLTDEEEELFNAWLADGGGTTASEFLKLTANDRIKAIKALEELIDHKELSAGGRDFVLVHAGLGNFAPEKPLSEYLLDDLLFERPDLTKTYYPDKYIVFGHTPTRVLREQLPDGAEDNDSIYERGKLIGIDCGCFFSGKLGCLCLDTLEKFYV